MKWKNNLILLFFVLGGVIFGALVANLTAGIPMLSWLAFGEHIGIGAANPIVLDLSVIRITFGLEIGVNVAQILCILLALLPYRAVGKKL